MENYVSFISTDWAEQMRKHVRYCAEKLDDVIVMGSDGIPDIVQVIQAGELTATVVFMQYENGYYSGMAKLAD